MANYDVRSRDSVVRAIEVYRRLGRNAFMDSYGGTPPKLYWINHEGSLYEAKAILDKAHRLEHPADHRPAGDFLGSKANVKTRLEKLGFRITER
jgi:hypothetical protein